MNTAAYYQRCVITCETVAVFHRRPFWQHLACCSANSMHLTGSETRFLPTPPAFYAPVRRVHVAILLCRSAWKTRMLCLTDSEKISKMSLFVLTRSTNVTDTHTHRMTAQAALYCRASRGKNRPILMKFGILHQILNPMTVTWPKIEIFKIQDVGGRHLKNRFFGPNSSTDCPI